MWTDGAPDEGRRDVAAIGVAAVVGALLVWGELADGAMASRREIVVWAVVGVLACAALLLRRRWPAWLVIGLAPASIVSPAAIGAAAVAVFSVAARRPWQVSLPVAGVHGAALAVVWGAVTDVGAPAIVTTIVALHVAVVSAGMVARSRRALVTSLRERAVQAEEGQQLRVDEARHLERERLAREMHDVLAHRISLLAVHAGALEVRREATGEERHAVGVIRSSAYAALEDLRDVIGMLRADGPGPQGDRPQPTIDDLPALVEESRRAGARITLDTRVDDLGAVPTSLGRHVYRVVQEGLTNARKHATGGDVAVTVAGRRGAGLTVEVGNALPDGAAPPLPGTGTGLVGLRERIDLVGGRLEHGHRPDGGFRLRAWIPWPS